MPRLTWDANEDRIYETGVDRGVFYKQKDDGSYDTGVAWNGLTAVNETPSGAEETALYADNIKYLSLRSAEIIGGTIEAYTYPDEFAACDGSIEVLNGVTIGQQTRSKFGFVYRTLVGNNVKGNDYGYKYHILYGCSVSPSERAYSTVNESPEAQTFSWELATTPEKATITIGSTSKEYATALVTIDCTGMADEKITAIENLLFGKDATSESANDGANATLPNLADLIEELGDIITT